MLRTDVFAPSRFTGKGSITLRGVEIPYHTVSEDNVFYDDEGKPIASIFSYSYFRSDVEDTKSRPVLFGFNGGPGTSSMMVHVGFLGTKRIKYGDDVDDDGIPLPPYESCDNDQCLLDVTDLVLVDPVGTGFGRLLDESKKELFYGIEPDAEALLTFIQGWLARYNRWHSPKYLLGESYGCTRASTAAGRGSLGASDRAFSVPFDGIIMVGNTVTTTRSFFDRAKPIYPAVLALPTLAATHWYHHRPSDQTVEEFVAEAKKFADTEYLLALYQGNTLQGEAREHIIRRLIYYTGVSREYLERRGLVIEDVEFRRELLREKGRSVARLDGRLTRPLYSPPLEEEKWGPRDDPSQGKYDSFFQSVLCGEVFPMLGIKWDRNFVNSARVGPWNNEPKGQNTAESLAAAMRRVPTMRTFFVNGWYDICTQIGILYYTLDHSDIPRDRTFVKGYKAGHMSYLGEDNIQEVTDDIRAFILGKDPTK